MTKHLSIYLDFLRVIAAMLVFIAHLGFFSGYKIPFLSSLSSEAVIIFFVLSGFVVAFSAEQKHKDLADYAISRVSRLWSVVVPALFLTIAADCIGQYIDSSQYGNIQSLPFYKWVMVSFINATFINQIWGFNISPGSNGPFWSISYEFWYYFIFGVLFYLKGCQRAIFLAAACIISGPHILLAFPVWLIGVLTYKLTKNKKCNNKFLSFFIYLLSILIMLAFINYNLSEYLKSNFEDFYLKIKWEAEFWPKSYLIALIVAINIYGFCNIGDIFESYLNICKVLIKRFADLTFGLYLFHYPLGYFFKVIASKIMIQGSVSYIIFIYVATLSASLLLAYFSELHKHKFKIFVEYLYGKILQLFGKNRVN